MPRQYYSFDNYLIEKTVNEMVSTTHADFQEVAPNFFYNAFYLGDSWFNRWMQKNNLRAETNDIDYNFLNIYDGEDNYIAAYHQYKGRIFTNLTLQQLNEQEEIEIELFNINEASLNKLYKDLAKVAGEMKSLAKKYKSGDKSVVSKLKELTAKKRKIEAEIEDEVGQLDDQFDESKKEIISNIIQVSEDTLSLYENVNESADLPIVMDNLIETLESIKEQVEALTERRELSIDDIDEDKLEKKVQELSKDYKVEKNGYDLIIKSWGKVKSSLVFDFQGSPVDVYMDGKDFGSGMGPSMRSILTKVMKWHKMVSKAKSMSAKAEQEWITSLKNPN